MPQNTNPKTPSPNNPSSLPPHFEIRKLEPKHSAWATAIVIHSNVYHSPIWPRLYPSHLTARAHKGLAAAPYLIDHQIASGHSYGVFDTTYTYKRPESAATGGALYWDETEPSVQETSGLEAESKRMSDAMDFPLVSVALSYDGFNSLDMVAMEPLLAVLPHFGPIYHILAELDARDPASWQPTAEGQVLFRNATSTRREYEGQGIMGGLARWLMREAKAKGFRGIQIECFNDAVTHVWSKAEEPFEGKVVSSLDTGTWVEEDGTRSFAPAEQVCAKVYVDLEPGA
ncbi:hypothetical protein BDV96DRAFT_106290 [Lophiotrema nucula]|uniref:N-acetyltransferase domain-containing protein n=1 Tax=Lophiotrema nucula TaxID=690887 RepID=A0A6A5Z4I0_9PLEO|nr:hypothetical protein BDV96DRAFT_106290 [Lophiotrema nucula]